MTANRIIVIVGVLVVTVACLWAFLGFGADEAADQWPAPSSTDGPPATADAAAEPTPETKQAARRRSENHNGAAFGRIVSRSDRSPLPGIAVQIALAESGVRRAETDARGRFRFDELPPLCSLEFLALAPDSAPMAPLEFELARGEEVDLGDLAVEAGSPLEGRVLASEGGPIEDAVVLIVPHAAIETRLDLDLFAVFDRIFRADRPLASTRTDKDGRFRFARLATGEYALVARAGGRQTRFSGRIRVREGEPTAAVTLHLDLGFRVIGTVVDQNGLPLSGVRVAALAERNRRDLLLKTHQTKSDEAGAFAFDALGSEPHILFARTEGFAPAALRNVGVDGAPVVLQLDAGLSIAGRVFESATGRGVGGVRVALAGLTVPSMAASPATDPEGRFRIEHVPRLDKAILVVDAPGYVIDLGGVEGRRPILGGFPVDSSAMTGQETLAIALLRCGAIAGRVIDQSTEAPIAGAVVRALVPDEEVRGLGARRRKATTRADGTFLLDGVPPGEVVLRVRAPGRCEGRFPALPDIDQELHQDEFIAPPPQLLLPEGGRIDGIEIRLGEAVSVHGLVVDPDGRPLEHATVRVDGDEATAVVTKDDGEFTIEGLRPDTTVTIEATHPSWPVVGVESIALGLRPVRGIRLRLRRAAVVNGRLVFEDGRPAASLTLAVRTRPTGNAAGGDVTRTATDEDGRFVAARLAPGFLDVRLIGAAAATLVIKSPMPAAPLAEGEHRDIVLAVGPLPTPPPEASDGR